MRHLFNAVPPSGSIAALETKLKTLLEQIEKPEFDLKKEHIFEFVDTYSEYNRAILSMNLFLYYARVYQFIQESLRVEFLESSAPLYDQIAAEFNTRLRAGSGMATAADESTEDLEDVHLLCEQLKAERAFFVPRHTASVYPPAPREAVRSSVPHRAVPVDASVPRRGIEGRDGVPALRLQDVIEAAQQGRGSGRYFDPNTGCEYQSRQCGGCGVYQVTTSYFNSTTQAWTIDMCPYGHYILRGG